MCYYHYYYFPGCRHQKTVLIAFCDKAERCAPAGASVKGSNKQSLPQGDEDRGKKDGKAHLPPTVEHQTSSSSQRQHTRISTPQTGPASITEEPLLEAASSSPQQTTQHPSQPPAEDMAGLAPFGNTLRSWMSSKAPEQTHMSPTHSVKSMNTSDEMVSCSLHSLSFT